VGILQRFIKGKHTISSWIMKTKKGPNGHG
jgi:hypothetical protein